jgi:hypothetical protein
MKQPIKLLNRIAGIVVLTMLTGCVPIPHTTEMSREVRGRVLDARTHAPIQGAKIFLTNIPKVSCTTDSAGYFWLKATHQFHLAFVPPEGDLPQRRFYEYEVTVSHTNYISRELNDAVTDEGEILLEPKR